MNPLQAQFGVATQGRLTAITAAGVFLAKCIPCETQAWPENKPGIHFPPSSYCWDARSTGNHHGMRYRESTPPTHPPPILSLSPPETLFSESAQVEIGGSVAAQQGPEKATAATTAAAEEVAPVPAATTVGGDGDGGGLLAGNPEAQGNSV